MSTFTRICTHIAALGCLTLSANAAPSLVRSMWVWQADAIVGDAAKTKQLLDFCGERGIRAVFVWAPELPQDAYPRWQALIATAHEKKVAVHALAGDQSWASKPQLPLTHIAAVVSYNSQVGRRERFDGVQHDINFSGADEYVEGSESKKASITSSYLESIRASREALDKLSPGLRYGVTMPRSLRDKFEWQRVKPGIATPQSIIRPLYAHIMESVGYTIILAFHDSAEAIIADTDEEVAYATRHGKILYVGVLTGTPEGYSDDMTFAQEGSAKMESALDAVTKHFTRMRGLRGFAIHDYSSYRELGP